MNNEEINTLIVSIERLAHYDERIKQWVIANFGTISTKFLVVDSLPEENIQENTIYFVKKEEESFQNKFDKFVYVEGDWENLGSFDIDEIPDLTDIKNRLSELENSSTLEII